MNPNERVSGEGREEVGSGGVEKGWMGTKEDEGEGDDEVGKGKRRKRRERREEERKRERMKEGRV